MATSIFRPRRIVRWNFGLRHSGRLRTRDRSCFHQKEPQYPVASSGDVSVDRPSRTSHLQAPGIDKNCHSGCCDVVRYFLLLIYVLRKHGLAGNEVWTQKCECL